MCILFRTGGEEDVIFSREEKMKRRGFQWGKMGLKRRWYYEEPIVAVLGLVKRLMTCSMKAFSHSAAEWMMKEPALQKAVTTSFMINSLTEQESLQPLQHREASKHLGCLYKLPQMCTVMMLDLRKNRKLEMQSVSVMWRRWSAQSCIVPLFASVQVGWLDRLQSPSGCTPLTESAHMGAWYFKHENLGENEIGKARH